MAVRRRCGTRQKVFPLMSSAHWVKRHACARFRATTQGRPYGSMFRNMDFTRAPTKRQRSAFCGKEEAPAPKAKVFRRKTEQMHRAPTTGQASRLAQPCFIEFCWDGGGIAAAWTFLFLSPPVSGQSPFRAGEHQSPFRAFRQAYQSSAGPH